MHAVTVQVRVTVINFSSFDESIFLESMRTFPGIQ